METELSGEHYESHFASGAANGVKPTEPYLTWFQLALFWSTTLHRGPNPLTSRRSTADVMSLARAGRGRVQMRRIGLLGVTVAALGIISNGCSRTEAPKPASSEPLAARPGAVGEGGAGANLSDGDFVRDVALKNMANVELSRMAFGRATSPSIKAFAQKIVSDHESAAQNLKSTLSGQPISWPTQLDDKHRKTVDELAKKQGADFDRDYVKAMIEGHQDLAAKLESRLDVQSLTEWKTAAAGRAESKALPQPDTMRDVQVRPDISGREVTMKINRWAAETYPLAQKLLDMARTLETTAKPDSTN
jgi:putative membrane protein